MASVKVPEQKVILCGEFGVGKSSLFRRYATNSFVTATDRQSTLGLDHYDKAYKVADKEIRVRQRLVWRVLWIAVTCCVIHGVPLVFFTYTNLHLISQVEFKMQCKQCSIIVAVVGHRRYGKSCFYYIQLLQVC
jgi:GTPase SAR1 family protein